MTGVLTILYVTNIQGFSTSTFGTLIAIQMIVSILVYIPAGKIADRIGRKPFVIVTFLSFALFPLAVILASQLRFADSGFRRRRTQRNWGAFTQGNDRRLRARGFASAFGRTLLPGSQSFDYAGGCDWRSALEDFARRFRLWRPESSDWSARLFSR